MSYNDVSLKVEQAITRLILTSAGVSESLIALGGPEAGQRVYIGTSGVEKSAPCVVISAVSSQEEPYDSGNYWVQLSVESKASPEAADGILIGTRNGFADLASAVGDALHSDTLVDDVTASALTASDTSGDIGLTCIGWRDRSSATSQSQDVWSQTVDLMLYCGPSSLS